MKTSSKRSVVKQRYALGIQALMIHFCDKNKVFKVKERTITAFEIKSANLKRKRKKHGVFPNFSLLRLLGFFKVKPNNYRFLGKNQYLIIGWQKKHEIAYNSLLNPLTHHDLSIAPALANNIESNTFLTRVEKTILNNIDQNEFGPTELSYALKMSRGHLHRKVKAFSGCTTTDFMHSTRIKLAFDLLKNSSLSVKEIAYKVGYKDPGYFTRVFTRLVGQSPSHFNIICPSH